MDVVLHQIASTWNLAPLKLVADQLHVSVSTATRMAKAQREGHAAARSIAVTYTGHSAQSGAAMRGLRCTAAPTSSLVIDVE